MLSQKEFKDNSLASQKNPGWVFYVSGGTWAWSLGSGSRRLTYERDNGQHMPLNTDAFRALYPDVRRYPGPSHRSGRRIDQLYYKGAGLDNTSTRIISTRPAGFPSDHFLILSRFDLDYSTRRTERHP